MWSHLKLLLNPLILEYTDTQKALLQKSYLKNYIVHRMVTKADIKLNCKNVNLFVNCLQFSLSVWYSNKSFLH